MKCAYRLEQPEKLDGGGQTSLPVRRAVGPGTTLLPIQTKTKFCFKQKTGATYIYPCVPVQTGRKLTVFL